MDLSCTATGGAGDWGGGGEAGGEGGAGGGAGGDCGGGDWPSVPFNSGRPSAAAACWSSAGPVR